MSGGHNPLPDELKRDLLASETGLTEDLQWKGEGNGRWHWRGKKGLYEWDKEKGRLEVYKKTSTSKGKWVHQGEYDLSSKSMVPNSAKSRRNPNNRQARYNKFYAGQKLARSVISRNISGTFLLFDFTNPYVLEMMLQQQYQTLPPEM